MQCDKGFGKSTEVPVPGLKLIGDGSSRQGVLEEGATHVHLKTTESKVCRKGGNERGGLQLARPVSLEVSNFFHRYGMTNELEIFFGMNVHFHNYF